MSDTDNWPLLRAWLIGKKADIIVDSLGWFTSAGRISVFAYADYVSAHVMNGDSRIFGKMGENEAVAWARANLGREE
jgi:hypothetical protein